MEGLQLMKKGAQTLISESAIDYLANGHIHASKQEKFDQYYKSARTHL